MNIKIEPEDESLPCKEWKNSNRDNYLQNNTIGILNNLNEGLSTGRSDRVPVKKEELFAHDDNCKAEEVASVFLRVAKTEEEAKNLKIEKFEPLTDPLKTENNPDASVCSYNWNECEQNEAPLSEISSQENFPISPVDIEEFNIKREMFGHQPIVVDLKLERTVTNDRNLVCSGCHGTFSPLLGNAQREQTYKCGQCESESTRSSQLKSLTQAQSVEKTFKCDECQSLFRKNSDLRRHLKIHSGEKRFKCETCLYVSARKSYLILHQRTHSGEKPFKCDQCLLLFARKENLITHQRNHSGEKPFKCDQCHYKTSSKTYMGMHKMTHSGEKPFKCHQCQYECVTKSSMTRHQILHSGEKPYECDHCQYTCASKSNLTKHQMVHLDKVQMYCDQCRYRCTRMSSWLKHQMKHSGEMPSNDQNQNKIIENTQI